MRVVFGDNLTGQVVNTLEAFVSRRELAKRAVRGTASRTPTEEVTFSRGKVRVYASMSEAFGNRK